MNGNSLGNGQLKKFELSFKGTSYEFAVNPEQYEIKLQNRANVLYTKGGAFVDMFGEGLKEITFSGTTGLKNGTGDLEDGYKKMISLKKLIEDNMNNIQNGTIPTDFLDFYNHTDGEGYVTIPIRFNVFRNANQPLLYKYDINLIAIRKISEPEPSQEVQKIGILTNGFNTAIETILDRKIVERTRTNPYSYNIKKNPLAYGVAVLPVLTAKYLTMNIGGEVEEK